MSPMKRESRKYYRQRDERNLCRLRWRRVSGRLCGQRHYAEFSVSQSCTARNSKKLGFEAGVAYAPTEASLSGMGADFKDVNNDGLPDIWYSTVEHEEFPLLIDTGKGDFLDMTVANGLAKTTDMSGWGNGMVDFDNDGWKDLFVARANVMDNISEANPCPALSGTEHHFPEPGPWQVSGCERNGRAGFSKGSGASRRGVWGSGQRWTHGHGCVRSEWTRGAVPQYFRDRQSLDPAETCREPRAIAWALAPRSSSRPRMAPCNGMK